jgi:hypothetical protein
MASQFYALVQAAFLEARAILDPSLQVILTGPNGQTAQVVATSFPQSKTLKEARLDAKLPVRVTMLNVDLARLAIVDRSQVTIYGQTLTVIVIDSDPVDDPLVDLTLSEFS